MLCWVIVAVVAFAFFAARFARADSTGRYFDGFSGRMGPCFFASGGRMLLVARCKPLVVFFLLPSKGTEVVCYLTVQGFAPLLRFLFSCVGEPRADYNALVA